MNMHVTTSFEEDPAGKPPMHSVVRECLAIVQAISAGELLAALPEAEYDKQRHQTAVTLLELLETRLRDALESSSGGIRRTAPSPTSADDLQP